MCDAIEDLGRRYKAVFPERILPELKAEESSLSA